MPTKLRKLKITRVAVCPQGANYDVESGEGAHILLFKAAGPEEQAVPPIVPEDTEVVGRPSGPGGVLRPTLTPAFDKQSPPHAEPDGDEQPPLDYATRGQQQDLWRGLWERWERFVGTFYDVTGDCDDDNIPHLPILVTSIGQFQDDVRDLLASLQLAAKMAPGFAQLADVVKAGAPMAGHRLTRLREAIQALTQILDECTPAAIDRPGVSAAEAAGLPLTSTPFVMKRTQQGGSTMALAKNMESDEAHCKDCDDKDCDNPAHDRMKKEAQMAETLDGVTKRAELAEARVKDLEAQTAELAATKTDLAEAQAALAAVQEEVAIAKMSPEEQHEALLKSMPPLVLKSYLDQQSRLELIEKANKDLHEKNERLDYIAKTVELRPLGFVPDDHWSVLKAIDLMPEKDKDELTRLLKAATEQVRTSALWTTSGSQGTSTTGGDGSAEQQIMGLADAYQKEKGGSLGDAIGAIAKQHPDLWARDQREKRFKNRVESR